jgi:DNA-binding NarL/FixJ family response regulator
MPDPDPHAYTILIVDDAPANLGMLIDAMSKDYRVLVAESGESCFEQLPFRIPDLILMDMLMPGLNGLECLQRLRADPATAHIPVIFMTAVDDPEQRSNALQSGAVDYVVKPVYIPEVLARIATHLHILTLRRELERQNEALAIEVQMRRETEQQLEQSIERGLMILAADGQVLFTTRKAANLIRLYYASSGEVIAPEPFMSAWRSAVATNGTGWQAARKDSSGQLHVTILSNPQQSAQTILYLDEDNAGDARSLMQLGLSPRESEVLFWMAEGKTYPEIADILGAATRTIHKHAENLMRKLQLESRSAAMRLALEILR